MWSEITELCRAAAGELSDQHPMVNIEGFSLHDAMSAVEVKVRVVWDRNTDNENTDCLLRTR